MNKDAIYHNFLLFCSLIEVARQWWFLIFVRRVFVSKISSNSIAFKWLTPTHVRTNFFNQIYHILASFASYCPLSTRPNIVAHTSSSTSSLTFSSISWAWRHTSWCVAFSCSTAKGTASQLWSTFTFYGTFLDGCRVTKQNVCGSSHQENRSQNMDTLHMLTEPIRKANARRLQEETNGLIKEFIYATLL